MTVNHEVDAQDMMAKTSMFGGEINSAELPISPKGMRLLYVQPN